MLESTPDKPAATAGGELAGWILGIVVSQAIYVATVLGTADLLAGGPRSATALALAADAGPDGLYRLLRLLVGHGIFVELPGGRFANSAQSELLREVPGSLRALAGSVGERDYPALGDGNPGRGGRPRRPAGGDGTPRCQVRAVGPVGSAGLDPDDRPALPRTGQRRPGRRAAFQGGAGCGRRRRAAVRAGPHRAVVRRVAAAGAGAPTPGSTCAPPWNCLSGWVPLPGPSGPVPSCGPVARPPASATQHPSAAHPAGAAGRPASPRRG
jgi:hypothetical protein